MTQDAQCKDCGLVFQIPDWLSTYYRQCPKCHFKRYTRGVRVGSRGKWMCKHHGAFIEGEAMVVSISKDKLTITVKYTNTWLIPDELIGKMLEGDPASFWRGWYKKPKVKQLQLF